MMLPKISVIVPVYKVEKYLDFCVNSIFNQTYKNLEIILVDDGSPDLCPTMCDNYAKRDHRVLVIHKKNGGLSDARNAGLDVATGEYILFVDSDDYIEEDACERLLESVLRYGADIAIFNYLRVDESYQILSDKPYKQPIQDGCLNKEQIWEELLQPYGGYYVVAWNKLYSRKIFSRLRFPFSKQHEDEFVIHHVVNQCEKIACVNKPLYYYVQRDGSIMAQKFNVKYLDYGDALIDRYVLAKTINHKKLKKYCVKQLSYRMEKWKNYAEVDEKCKIKYDELRKKARFLLYEKGAWEEYSWRGRFFMRLELFSPCVGNLLRKWKCS